jgi:hypothetical protein
MDMRVLIIIATLLATGCLKTTKIEQDVQLDLLFVMDNSDSMMDEATSLASNIDEFIAQLTDNDQLSITTVDVEASYGALYGSPSVLTKGESRVEEDFIANLLCDATCFSTDAIINSDPAHDCGDEIGDNVTSQYLDCACGTDAWKGNCGAGTEEGLEAIFMALCRAVEQPPEACYDIVNQFTEADVLSNEGMLRPDATFMPIIITDEGDYGTRRMSQGEVDISAYIDLFERFDLRMSPVFIGPVWDPEFGDFRCPTGAGGGWSALRYTQLVDNYGGLQINIVDPDNNCEPTLFSDSLAQIAEFIESLPSSPEPTVSTAQPGRELPF